MACKSPGVERPSKDVAVTNIRSKKMSKKPNSHLSHQNSVPLSGEKKERAAVQKDDSATIVHMNGANETVSVNTNTKLPNQPLTPVVTETPRSSELCSAAVKWKSKLTLLDADTKIKKSSGELVLDKNESSVTPRDESPRPNHSTVTMPGESDGEEASPTRKLSLGDFVTDESAAGKTQEPVVWNDMEGSTTGLVRALPYVPVSLAYTCLMLNIIIPGSGTIIAGISMMCCGEPRGQVKPDEMFHQFTTNIFVGVSQFFTVTFFLAGWIWSVTWGIYIVLFAEANKRRKAEEKKRNKTAVIANTLWNR